MHGTLHKKVLEEYPSELGPGAGLILKHVCTVLGLTTGMQTISSEANIENRNY